MYHIVEAQIRQSLATLLDRRGIAGVPIITQRSPNVAMGEVATPIAFELAKRLRRAPRQIAQELAKELTAEIERGGLAGVAHVEPAGGGYVNFFLDRAAFFAAAAASSRERRPPPRPTRRNPSSSTPTSTPTKPRTSAIFAMPSLATPWCASCAAPAAASKCRTTSTIPACR